MEQPDSQVREAPQLGLWDAVSIIIGIVVGTGIYETPPLVLKNVSGPWEGLGVWALGGVLSLVGALCYAELATTYPRSGGDYVYLSRAYGPWMGFLFGWAQLAVILTGSIGMLAYVFADYATRLWDWGPASGCVYAALAVTTLAVLNALGIVFGKGAQNVLTAAKVLGLGGILAAGLFRPEPLAPSTAPAAVGMDSLAFAMVLVFLTYGGWNDAAYVAAEVRDGRRNIPRALILGVAGITLLYLLVNAAYLWALGFDGARQSNAVAADVLGRVLGPSGERAMCLLVMVSALGAVNGLIFAGSRVYSTLGADHSIFAWLGRGRRRGAPLGAIVTQALLSLAMIVVLGTAAGRAGVDALFARVGLEGMPWQGRSGFETLLRCTAPVFWLFFLLTGISLFVLRFLDRGRDKDNPPPTATLPQRDPEGGRRLTAPGPETVTGSHTALSPDVPRAQPSPALAADVRARGLGRPFTVPLYPVLPLIFCATCAYMLYGGIQYAGKLGLIGGLLLLAGLPLYWISCLWARPPAGGPASE
jgi:amino acid transporter